LHGTLRELLDALFGAELLVLNSQALLELSNPFRLAVTQINERSDAQQGNGWQDAEERNPEM
jgi:hypothetical protein